MHNILIFIQSYLFGRLGSRILGLMLILSLIWWAGPFVGLRGTKLRIYSMAGILLVFLAVWLVRKWLTKRRGDRLKQDLDSQAGQDQSRQMEIEELRDKMNKAIASLKSSELGTQHRGNAALYALPWFMIIGPSAAGKTTLLRNSGLSFPYASGDDIDIRGFGGTRNCDWWFSNEAVLLDTAGRYTTEQDDHEEWLAFLGMLRKHRRQQPLTGAIVAISLSDLLTADAQEMERHVKIIRDRINELTARLGCIFPIYIVFTKCDLLYGFSSYFADLTPEERDQVWGCWLGHEHDDDIKAAFAEKMEGLYQRLCEMRLYKLSMVRNIRAKSELFDFPSQFAAARERLVEFVEHLTRQNPYQDTPHFCGIYLTSATQEGTPLQKILGNMRQAFGYVDEEQDGKQSEPKSYFVKNFFKEVVFPNSNDVSRTRKLGLIHRTLKTAFILASLGAVIACFLLLSTTLTMNTLLLKKGNAASEHLVAEIRTDDNGLYRDFQALTQVLEQYRTLSAYEKRLPLTLTIGIYEGDRQLPAIRAVLLKAYERVFFKPAVQGLEMRLTNFAQQWTTATLQGQDEIREPYYEALKCYLMLGAPKRLDPDFVEPVLRDIIQERLTDYVEGKTLCEADQRDLSELTHLFLACMLMEKEHPDHIAPYEPVPTLISEAQNHLRAIPDAGRLYTQLLNKSQQKHAPIPFRDMLKGPGRNLLSSSFDMPFMFTSEGWQTYVNPEIATLVTAASQGDWVTGYLQEGGDTSGDSSSAPSLDEREAARLEASIRAYYFADYADHWFTLLGSVQTASFNSLDDGAKKMLFLARNDGPIAELLQVVSKNIHLTENDVAALADGTGRAPVAIPELDAPLRDLRKLTDPGDKMNTSLLINQYLLALTSAQSELEQLAAAVDVPEQSYQHAATILGSNGPTNSELYKCWLSTNSLLNGIDARTRKIAERLLNEPIRGAWSAIMQQTRIYLQNQWNNSVLLDYQRLISGRFPFSDTGPDASLNDLSDFFRPEEGSIWAFTEDRLQTFLQKERYGWTEKTWLGLGPAFNRDLLSSLNQASRISSGMFRRGQYQPEVQFSIYPIPTQGVRVFRFETNGQHLLYQNEPQEWKRFRWPGDQDQSTSLIGCIPSGSHSMTTVKFSGDWSLFHLLRQARVSHKNNLYHLVWEVKTDQGSPATVQLELRPDRHANIFASGLFSQFRLPETIF